MNSILTNIKNLGVFFAAASTLLLFSQPAGAVIANLSPSNFSLSAETPGGEVNAVGASNAINQASPTNGFGTVFDEDFLLLGAITTASDIHDDGLISGNSTANSSNFSLTGTDLAAGITVDFEWAFNGNSVGTPFEDQDKFSILLKNFGVPTESAFVLGKAAAGDYGSGTESVNVNTSGLSAGNYFLQITLDENSGNLNSSAAGFNQIAVSTSVPFEFSPSVGLIMMGGIFVYSRYAKSRKVKQELENI